MGSNLRETRVKHNNVRTRNGWRVNYLWITLHSWQTGLFSAIRCPGDDLIATTMRPRGRLVKSEGIGCLQNSGDEPISLNSRDEGKVQKYASSLARVCVQTCYSLATRSQQRSSRSRGKLCFVNQLPGSSNEPFVRRIKRIIRGRRPRSLLLRER